ncbi:MAG: RloB family protein [Sphaerochaeta sp.]|uniref:RloB family protein n=1 Tax=Sphaerochaeta sp. TaxID=1972642 RepID=UPI002FCBB421
MGTPFGERYAVERKSVLPKSRHFIACEGRRTEYQYFKGLMQFAPELGISPAVEMIPLRHGPHTGSNPLHIYEETAALLASSGHYRSDLDHVSVIVDRDRHSFTAHQLEQMLILCKQAGYRLCISNPCFELWLLMHYSDLSEYDPLVLLENKRIGNRTQVERYLMEKLGGRYNKSRIHFLAFFRDRVPQAISNARRFPSEADHLKESVGSGVGSLIEALQQSSSEETQYWTVCAP